MLDLSEGRGTEVDFAFAGEAASEGLFVGWRDDFVMSLACRDGPWSRKPVRGDFAAGARSTSSALRFGADEAVFVTVDEGRADFSPVIDASRSLI